MGKVTIKQLTLRATALAKIAPALRSLLPSIDSDSLWYAITTHMNTAELDDAIAVWEARQDLTAFVDVCRSAGVGRTVSPRAAIRDDESARQLLARAPSRPLWISRDHTLPFRSLAADEFEACLSGCHPSRKTA